MTALIGDGGHARDIRATIGFISYTVRHHCEFDWNGPYIIGVNDCQLRAKIAAEIGRPDDPWVHPDAYMGPGTGVDYGAHINYRVGMTRTEVGSHSTICPGVTIAGDVTIGERVFVGAGATIGNLLTIGDDVVIGAGAVILGDVPAGARVVGVWKP